MKKHLFFTLSITLIAQTIQCSTLYSQMHYMLDQRLQPSRKAKYSTIPYFPRNKNLEFPTPTIPQKSSLSISEIKQKYPDFDPQTQEIDDYGNRVSKPIRIKRKYNEDN